MPPYQSTAASIAFDTPLLGVKLDAMRDEPGRYDGLEFGLVAMDLEGQVLAYNSAEGSFAGHERRQVLGLNFFTDVAPCTNNFLIAGRFEEARQLDEIIDYVFTIKMRLIPVRLRLLKNEATARQYLAIQW